MQWPMTLWGSMRCFASRSWLFLGVALAVQGVGVCGEPDGGGGRSFEVFLDRSGFRPSAGLTPSGREIQVVPTGQSGLGLRMGCSTDASRAWVWDFTGGLRYSGLSAVTTEGTDAGVAIRAGSQFSGLFGAALRRNGGLGYGLGLEGRVSSLVTELDGEPSRRKLVVSPWLRAFAEVWGDGSGRYVRIEAGLNLVSRKFESRDYSNPRWAPWSDPSLSPSTITAAAFWEPRWSIGLAVGFHPPRRVAPVAQVPAPGPLTGSAGEAQATSEAPRAAVPTVVEPSRAPGAVIRTVSGGAESIPSFTVYFQAGRHALTNEAVVVMSHWLAKIGKDQLGAISIEVGGHADPHGARKANLRLSRKRAEAVASFLAAHGVERGHILVKWFGGPLAAHRKMGRSGWAAERRVDGRAKKVE